MAHAIYVSHVGFHLWNFSYKSIVHTSVIILKSDCVVYNIESSNSSDVNINVTLAKEQLYQDYEELETSTTSFQNENTNILIRNRQ